MSTSTIDELVSRASSDIKKIIEEAFEAGRNDMRQQLASLLLAAPPHTRPTIAGSASSEILPRGPTPELDSMAADRIAARAQSGTVKPAIKDLVDKSTPNGIRTAEIIEQTGFKENSVRGTLSTLKAEGVVERRGEFWFPVKAEGPSSMMNGPS